MNVWYILGGATLAALTGAFGYLSIRWTKSGGIRTSEANTLWEESRMIRRELRDELAKVQLALAACEEESARRGGEITTLQARVLILEQRPV